jgi:hypothetical protein
LVIITEREYFAGKSVRDTTYRANAPVAGGPVETAAAGGAELMKRRNQDAMVDFYNDEVAKGGGQR